MRLLSAPGGRGHLTAGTAGGRRCALPLLLLEGGLEAEVQVELVLVLVLTRGLLTLVRAHREALPAHLLTLPAFATPATAVRTTSGRNMVRLRWSKVRAFGRRCCHAYHTSGAQGDALVTGTSCCCPHLDRFTRSEARLEPWSVLRAFDGNRCGLAGNMCCAALQTVSYQPCQLSVRRFENQKWCR